jgi:hypothetical protein
MKPFVSLRDALCRSSLTTIGLDRVIVQIKPNQDTRLVEIACDDICRSFAITPARNCDKKGESEAGLTSDFVSPAATE